MGILGLFITFVYAGEGTGHIRFLQDVTLPANTHVLVRDIAIVQGFGKRETERVQAVRLTTTGPRGSEQFLTAAEISKKLRAQLKTHAQLNIPAKVHIQVPQALLNPTMIEQALLTRWQAGCVGCEIKISEIKIPEIQETVASAGIHFRVEPEIPKGNFSLATEIVDSAQNARIYWITGRVDLYQKVPVATRAIGPGEAFDAGSVQMELRNITYASDGFLPVEKFVGQKSRAALSKGQIIWSNFIQKEKAFHRGDVVHLVAAGTAFSVSASGIAEQDASVGDMVKVKNQTSGKLVSGVVVGKNEVRVE